MGILDQRIYQNAHRDVIHKIFIYVPLTYVKNFVRKSLVTVQWILLCWMYVWMYDISHLLFGWCAFSVIAMDYSVHKVAFKATTTTKLGFLVNFLTIHTDLVSSFNYPDALLQFQSNLFCCFWAVIFCLSIFTWCPVPAHGFRKWQQIFIFISST